MKMNYVHIPHFKNSSRRGGWYSLPLKILVVIISILTLFYFFAPHFLSDIFSTMVSPLWRGQNTVSGIVPGVLREASTMQKNVLMKENEDLKRLLGRSENKSMTLFVILKKPPFSAYDILVIDGGNDQGLRVGDKAYVSIRDDEDTITTSQLGNISIGEIVEVNTTTSKIKLYSSTGEKFEVLIGDKHVQAWAIGKGAGTFEVSLPRDAKVARGNTVTIPSLSDSFVGVVEEIISDPSEPFMRILFRQPINIFELQWVLIKK